jgi:TPR repeat protein
MKLNGRSSSDNQRPSTSASKTSAKSSTSLHSEHSYYSTDATSYNNSREPSSMDTNPPFDMGPIDPRGPARSMTMPQGPVVNQHPPTRPGDGLDFGLGPRDAVDARANATLGVRNGPGPSSTHRPRDTLDDYMPNFDAVQEQPSPLEDSLGLPLDGTPGIARPPTRAGTAPPMQNHLQRTKSQPDLRGGNDDFAFGPPGAPAVPRMPDGYGAVGNGFRSRSPGPNPNRAMMGAPGPYGPSQPGHGPGFGPPVRPGLASAPRNGLPPGPVPVRPGLPGRLNTGQGWPDGAPGNGPFSAPAGPSSDPRSPQSNPDALPFHPSPGVPNEPPPMRAKPNANQPAPEPEKPVTYLELNDLREHVKSNPTDYKTQFKLAKRLVEAAAVLSDEEGNADQKTRNKNREKFIFEAHKNIKKLVQHSYTEAMFYLADCYGTGQLGLAVDHKEAFNLYQAAAKLGHPAAAYRTAVCCEVGGEGSRRDPLKAVQWYRRAAALGEVGAMYKLGMVLLRGLLGQQSSVGEAVIWLNRAADHADEENPHAVHELALLHEMPPPGGKIIKDEKYSLQLYERAAKMGYPRSQTRLGKAFETGLLNVPIDDRASIHWYSKAAAQGDAEAELALSAWYLTGARGVLEPDESEAYLWARKSAMKEFPKAEYAMGYYSEVGIGCPTNLEDAKRWYGRAACKRLRLLQFFLLTVLAHNYAKAQQKLEDLRRGRPQRGRQRISRSQRNEECVVM